MEKIDERKFSVCMSVYRNDNPSDFKDAVFSIYRQTVPPSEIVLVVDIPYHSHFKMRSMCFVV